MLSIGQHAFVDSAGKQGSVALADASGNILPAVQLEDGSKVEVIARRPLGATETRYRVRSPEGVDGWLSGENLREAFVPVVAAPESAAPARAPNDGEDGGRRFGQRAHTGTAAPSSTSPAPPAPWPSVPDNGGRRFGQH